MSDHTASEKNLLHYRAEIKGTRTAENLKVAFSGESQARNKYTYFAEQAREEDCEHIAEIFRDTAVNEQAHAEIWYKIFAGIGDTQENLMAAAEGEHQEWSVTYPEFARVAREEGFEDIAQLFEAVAAIEREHEAMFDAVRKLIPYYNHKGVRNWRGAGIGANDADVE